MEKAKAQRSPVRGDSVINISPAAMFDLILRRPSLELNSRNAKKWRHIKRTILATWDVKVYMMTTLTKQNFQMQEGKSQHRYSWAPSPDSYTFLPLPAMLFFSYFKDLVGREVTVELKNDLAIRGTLHSVDQYLNIKLENTRVVDQEKFPHMLSVRNCFIRGSVVRYVQLPPEGVDIELLHDATRREARGG
ncbi:hypothetical protein L2E82_00119 [Cichorium intybus]|uniref:Uncharacterized protein n=2 Tax=Asteraceae TaxID=4210 RepID=A0ACB9GXE3_CICIN|nr:hypothetical protein L2E82_00119 [Cichorium intybus]